MYLRHFSMKKKMVKTCLNTLGSELLWLGEHCEVRCLSPPGTFSTRGWLGFLGALGNVSDSRVTPM